jgi:anti-anti-sigma factor
MSPGRCLRIEQVDGTLVVTPLLDLVGRADADVAHEWSEARLRLSGPAVQHVAVNLGETPYFGSMLLERIVQLWKLAREKGGRLAVSNVSEIGREVLRAARFDQVWELFDKATEAFKLSAEAK